MGEPITVYDKNGSPITVHGRAYADALIAAGDAVHFKCRLRPNSQRAIFCIISAQQIQLMRFFETINSEARFDELTGLFIARFAHAVVETRYMDFAGFGVIAIID